MVRDNSFYKNHPDLEVQDMFGEYAVNAAQLFIEHKDNVCIDFNDGKLCTNSPYLFVTFDSGDYIGDVEAKLIVTITEHLLDNDNTLSEAFEKDNKEFLESKDIL